MQDVVNENDDVLSSKASALLMTRYQGFAYFESEDKKETIEKALVGRILTGNNVFEIDISPSEDFLICGYRKGVELFSLSDFKSLWNIDDFVVERNAARFKSGLVGNLFYKPHRCIVFHPRENVIFPGQLTPVLNLEGKFESGRIVCEELPNKFTSCCFSHNKTKMVTNYGIHLTVWNLLKNKKIVSLSCRSELFSVLFSANDRFIGTTNINELCVYDTENSYSMVSRSYGAENYAVLVSTSYSDSWYVIEVSSKGGLKNEIVKHDLTIKPVSKRFTGIFPVNASAAAEFQAVMESDDDSQLFHKLIGIWAAFFILSNESVLVSTKLATDIKLFRLTELIQNSNKKKQTNKCISSLGFLRRFFVSVDGRYIYASHLIHDFSIVKLSWPRSVKSITGFNETIYNSIVRMSFVPVTNGVFVRGEIRKSSTGKDELCASIPELWNFGVTQRLASFPELTGTCYCLSVAQDLVACIMQSQVCFFNVLKKAIIARTPFPEHILREHELEKMNVTACSSLYHVLMGNTKFTYLLQCANSAHLNSCVFTNIMSEVANTITAACFSPNGQSLALCFFADETLYILDIATLNIRGKFSLYSTESSKVEFVDEEHLLCEGYNDCLCLINVKTCDILTCIRFGLDYNPWGVFACRNTVGIIVYSREYEKFKLIKLWLPQQRKDGNELLECSCWMHGGNINDPPTPTEIPIKRSRYSII